MASLITNSTEMFNKISNQSNKTFSMFVIECTNSIISNRSNQFFDKNLNCNLFVYFVTYALLALLLFVVNFLFNQILS